MALDLVHQNECHEYTVCGRFGTDLSAYVWVQTFGKTTGQPRRTLYSMRKDEWLARGFPSSHCRFTEALGQNVPKIETKGQFDRGVRPSVVCIFAVSCLSKNRMVSAELLTR